MNKQPAIIMDVDQVLLDHIGRLREYVNKRDGKDIKDLPCTWNLREWLQLDQDFESIDMINEFSKSYEFGTLDAFPGADVVLHSLLRKGYRLIALTACGTSEVTVALRKVNLFHRFGDIFDEIHFVELTESKTAKLLDISNRYDVKAFIDDKPENAIDALYGANIPKVILMKAPHNRTFRERNQEDIAYAYSWYECERFINEY